MKIPLAEMARRVTNRRRKIVMRPIETTSAQAAQLAAAYVAVLRIWQEGLRDQVLPAYSRTIAEQRGLVRDSVAEVELAISGVEARTLTAQATFRNEAENWAGGIERWHMRKFIAQIKYATNVDLSTMIGPADARLTIEQSVARNVALVRNVSDRVRGKVADIVLRGLQANTPVREVAKEIALATGLARDRALRIASDQTVKISAALDRERQQQMGMTSFEWRHSGKAHPREYHLARNKKVFEWDSEVAKTDPPGYAPFCGCKALGVLDLDGAGAGEVVSRPALSRSMVRPPRRLLPAVARPAPDPVPVAPPATRFAYEDFQPLKNIAAAEEWARANVTDSVNFIKSSKIDGINDILRATQEVSERFALPRLGYMGDPKGGNWRFPARAMAAYSKRVDAFIFKGMASDAKKQAAGGGYSQARATSELELAQSVVSQSRFVAPYVKENIGRMDSLPWIVSENPRGIAYHELGHRLHAFHFDEISSIFRSKPPTNEAWGFLIGKYSRTNDAEYVAETFSLYMQGDESKFWRIMPELLAFYKRKDLRNAQR